MRWGDQRRQPNADTGTNSRKFKYLIYTKEPRYPKEQHAAKNKNDQHWDSGEIDKRKRFLVGTSYPLNSHCNGGRVEFRDGQRRAERGVCELSASPLA